MLSEKLHSWKCADQKSNNKKAGAPLSVRVNRFREHTGNAQLRTHMRTLLYLRLAATSCLFETRRVHRFRHTPARILCTFLRCTSGVHAQVALRNNQSPHKPSHIPTQRNPTTPTTQ